jgi:hypothetical protein
LRSAIPVVIGYRTQKHPESDPKREPAGGRIGPRFGVLNPPENGSERRVRRLDKTLRVPSSLRSKSSRTTDRVKRCERSDSYITIAVVQEYESIHMPDTSTLVSRERVSHVWEVVRAQSLQRGGRLVAAPVRFVGFWAAVALPFLYLPLLIGGFEGEETLVFGLLLVANALALVVGHGHRR